MSGARSLVEEALRLVQGGDGRDIRPVVHKVNISLPPPKDPLIARRALRDAIAGGAAASEVMRLAGAVLDAQREQEALQVVREEIASLESTGRLARSTRTKSDVEPALRFLHGELEALVADVRRLDKALNGIGTAEAAVLAGEEAATAWRELSAAADRYEEIRGAQSRVMRLLGDSDNGRRVRWSGYLRDAFDREHVWAQERIQTSRRRQPSLITEDDLLAWLRDVPRLPYERPETAALPPEDRIGYLRWAATRAKLWVPTVTELEDAHTAAQAMLRDPADLARLRETYEARDRYYRGIKPAKPFPSLEELPEPNATWATEQRRRERQEIRERLRA